MAADGSGSIRVAAELGAAPRADGAASCRHGAGREAWTMETRNATQRFAALERKESLDEYNFAHFRFEHLAKDAKHTIARDGIAPGELAPDFELIQVGGGRVRLSDLRGAPVLLHFGSFT